MRLRGLFPPWHSWEELAGTKDKSMQAWEKEAFQSWGQGLP